MTIPDHPPSPVADPFAELLLAALPAAAAGARLLEVRVGPFWTVVHTSLGAGIASTMARHAEPQEVQPIAWAGTLHRRSPLELAGLLRSPSAGEAALGLAAVNALLGEPVSGAEEENAERILAARGAGRRVAVIGRFPFVDRLRPHCGTLWVFEQGPGRRPEDFAEEHVAVLIPEAEVVAVTATTLINHTLGGLLARVRPDAFTVMVGPSTPLHPLLFDHGFDVLCGSLVVDPTAVLLAASQGAVTPQVPGVRRVSLWREGARPG